MAEEHQEHADRLEDAAADMENQSKGLEGDIREAKSDWERKQQDESVPGATGIPDSQRGIPSDSGSAGGGSGPEAEEDEE